MKTLRKQIKESFFNPILYLFPVFLFLELDEFFGVDIAWRITFPVAFISIFYVYFRYKDVFLWYMLFTLFFLSVGLVISLVSLIPVPLCIHLILNKIIISVFFILLLIFRDPIQRSVTHVMPKLLPMSNNFNELYRFIRLFLSILIPYISVVVLLHFIFQIQGIPKCITFLKYVFLGVLVFMIFLELLRVQIIRNKLIREEWWPIVNEQGKIVGSIESLTSLSDEKKYFHPLIRLLLIDNSMIFLQKRSSQDLFIPGLWDTVISNHVRVGETIEQCVERTALERYGLENLKYIFLSKYIKETKIEKVYAFLFVTSKMGKMNINPEFVENTKWWTIPQIEDNLGTGIFSDLFESEFELIKRSGLLEM